MIETCFQVLPGRGQVRALRAALRPPWNASSLLIGRHSDPSLSLSLSPLPSPPSCPPVGRLPLGGGIVRSRFYSSIFRPGSRNCARSCGEDGRKKGRKEGKSKKVVF